MSNVLIVYAHPEPTSFNAALKDRAAAALREAGHSVTVSDLYAEGFDPVPGRHDFSTVADPGRFHYQTEQTRATRENAYSPEIAGEQARVAEADLLVLQFPLWWGGPPAILKGWCDRVLAYGFAYGNGLRFGTGIFKGRRALLSVTTGGTTQRFSPDGEFGDIRVCLWQVQHLTLKYLGYDTSEPFVAYATPRVTPAERENYLEAFAARCVAEAGKTLERKPLPQVLKPNEEESKLWAQPG